MRLTISIWLLCLSLNAATTYYVSTTGNDAADGSVGTPWATIGKAVTNMVSGDTTIIAAGIYNTEHKDVFTQADGATNSPIHLKSATPGTVTNQGNINVAHDWWIIDGLTFTALNADNTCCYLEPTADYLVFTNNLVTGNVQGPVMETHYDPLTSSKYCLIISNRFENINNPAGTEGVAACQFMGVANVFKGNTILNVSDMDLFKPFGTNHVISGNIISNVIESGGNPGAHADIFQLQGNDGGWGLGGYGNTIIFERNTIRDCPVQFFQLEQNGVQLGSNIIILNNLFMDSDLQSSISYGGVRFYNNTFIRCKQGQTGMLNVYFYGTNWWYYTNYAALLVGDQKPRGLAYGFDYKNNVQIDCQTSSVDYDQAMPMYWDGDSWEVDYNLPLDPPANHYPNWNYTCWLNYAAKTKVYTETNGINGGVIGYGNYTNLDFSLTPSSLIYQAGTPIAIVTNDFYGRPRLNPPSIGAFEFFAETPVPVRHDIPVTIMMPGR